MIFLNVSEFLDKAVKTFLRASRTSKLTVKLPSNGVKFRIEDSPDKQNWDVLQFTHMPSGTAGVTSVGSCICLFHPFSGIRPLARTDCRYSTSANDLALAMALYKIHHEYQAYFETLPLHIEVLVKIRTNTWIFARSSAVRLAPLTLCTSATSVSLGAVVLRLMASRAFCPLLPLNSFRAASRS